MLKIIGRILVILLVSGLIAGGIYLIVQHNPSAFGIGEGRAAFEGRLRNNFGRINSGAALSPESISNSNQPTRFRGDDHDFGGGISMGRGLLGVARNLIVFSLIILLVVVIQKGFSRVDRKRPVRAG
jgi:hypothetical protein